MLSSRRGLVFDLSNWIILINSGLKIKLVTGAWWDTVICCKAAWLSQDVLGEILTSCDQFEFIKSSQLGSIGISWIMDVSLFVTGWTVGELEIKISVSIMELVWRPKSLEVILAGELGTSFLFSKELGTFRPWPKFLDWCLTFRFISFFLCLVDITSKVRRYWLLPFNHKVVKTSSENQVFMSFLNFWRLEKIPFLSWSFESKMTWTNLEEAECRISSVCFEIQFSFSTILGVNFSLNPFGTMFSFRQFLRNLEWAVRVAHLMNRDCTLNGVMMTQVDCWDTGYIYWYQSPKFLRGCWKIKRNKQLNPLVSNISFLLKKLHQALKVQNMLL